MEERKTTNQISQEKFPELNDTSFQIKRAYQVPSTSIIIEGRRDREKKRERKEEEEERG